MPASMAPVSTNWQPELKRSWSARLGEQVNTIIVSTRGKVAVATRSSVFLYDGPPSYSQKQELKGQPAGLTAVCFSSKGTDVVAGGADGFLKWWQVDSGEETCSTQFPLADSKGQQELSVPEVACSKAGYVAAASGR